MKDYGFQMSDHVITISAKSEQDAMRILIDKFWLFIDKNNGVELLGEQIKPEKVNGI